MHAVKLTVDPEDLAADLASLRGWLDERRFEPLLFWYDTGGEKIIVELANEAAAFCLAFGGQMVDGERAPTPAPPPDHSQKALSTLPS